MKKHTLSICLGAILPFAVSVGQAEDKATLRIADYIPESHYVATSVVTPWMKKVTELSNGEVDFQYFPAQQLGKAKDLFSLAKSGVTDIAAVAPSYISDKLPLSGVAGLPEDFKNSCEGAKAYWKLAKPGGALDQAELKPNGVRALFVVVFPPYQFFTAQGEITDLESLADKKVRATGEPKQLALRKVGAVPVQIAAPDIRDSLARGTLDGVLFPIPSIPPYGLSELISYASKGLSFGSAAVVYLISTDRWASLPRTVQRAMTKAGEAIVDEGCESVDEYQQETVSKLSDAGVNFVTFETAERQKFGSLMSEVSEAWATGLDERGEKGTETLEAFRSAISAVKQ